MRVMPSPTDRSELKSRVSATIDEHRPQLVDLGLRIHANPEMGLNEHQAMKWITDMLAAHRFGLETGLCDLPTAFRASYGTTPPRIALIAEYDALPGLGHACGHNLIATAAVAAAISLPAAVDALGGTIEVIGTPAEESEGGKITLLGRGAFDNIAAAMMIHPSENESASVEALACVALKVDFFGREAHAASDPDKGLNALNAIIAAFNAINALRQHLPDGTRIHGIITDGGKAPNIVPGHSSGSFLVRTDRWDYLPELKSKVLDCFKAAALATGTRLEYTWGNLEFAPMLNAPELVQLYIENMAILGKNVPRSNPDSAFGSTDMGNVSQRIPSLHAEVKIASSGYGPHTPEFAQATGDIANFTPILQSAAALAMTAIDLLADPSRLSAKPA